MRKPVSVRRLKQTTGQAESANLATVNEAEQNIVDILSDLNNTVQQLSQQREESIQLIQATQKQLMEKMDSLLLDQKEINASCAETEQKNSKLTKYITSLEKEVNTLRQEQASVSGYIQRILSQVESISLLPSILTEIENIKNTSKDETKVILNQLVSNLNVLKNIGREDYKTILSLLVNKKQDEDMERTISFKLGKSLINSTKSIENLVKLPGYLFDLKKENESRKIEKKEVKVIDISDKSINSEPNKIVESGIAINKNINADLNKKFTKALTLLDPISELCWQDGFPGFAISRDKFVKQIESTTSDFAFFESAWKANKSQWLYAFNSPNLQHKNAKDLLKVIGLLRSKKVPVVFWNKEDPMHYEMFKPIAKEADFVFTTDSLKIDQYKKDLGHNFVWALPFAAPIKITNPINRFDLETETVCFAGTYYAKNHPDRKKQMDMLLPALLNNDGAIYDRASNTNSENYLYPDKYKALIRDGVEFDKMVGLYKKFKVFLNVNTITQSPTMMSRRVYELLASGTPVVSTPSKAITEQFPGIVLTVRNEEEAQIAVNKLLTDSYFWHKQSVLGIREVMSKHTYEGRWSHIKSLMQGNDSFQEQVDNVRVIAKYHGYQDIDAFVNNILQQSVKVNELVLIVSSKNYDLLSKKLEDYNGKVLIKTQDKINLKEYISIDENGYTLFVSDAVIIFRNCIKDMLLSFKYHDGYVATRAIYYSMKKLETDGCLQISGEKWYGYSSETDITCSLIKNNYKSKILIDLNKGSIKLTDNECKIFQIDPFNIVSIERKLISAAESKNHEKFKYKYSAKLGL